MALVTAHNLSKDYIAGEIKVEAIRNVDFTINSGSFVSFIGPSGSGKSTLLNMIGCLDPPTKGSLTVAGLDITTMNKKEKPVFEIHTWSKLSPFSNIARMIDLMPLFIKIMLVAIVLVSIMNVMIMSVYERINEIGTIAAIGTKPGKILALFVTEGFLLGVLGTLMGVVLSLISIAAMNISGISFNFGRQEGLLLAPTIGTADVIIIAGIVILISILGSLQPAWKAAKMDPITALQHV